MGRLAQTLGPINTTMRTPARLTTILLICIYRFVFAQTPTTVAQVNPCAQGAGSISCFALIERKRQLQKVASGDKNQWAKVAYILNENVEPPFSALSDGSVVDIYSGVVKSRNSGTSAPRKYSNSDRASIQMWNAYSATVHQNNLDGNISYDIYPCVDNCEGHKAGFSWAETNRIGEFSQCPRESISFSQGCAVFVRRAKKQILPGSSAQ